MTPTPDQVAQWAREAGLVVGTNISGVQLVGADMHGTLLVHLDVNDLHRLVTRAMAEQAESDAKLCEEMNGNAYVYPADCADSIRANAPKQQS